MFVFAVDVVDDYAGAVGRHRQPILAAQRALGVFVAALPVLAHGGAGKLVVRRLRAAPGRRRPGRRRAPRRPAARARRARSPPAASFAHVEICATRSSWRPWHSAPAARKRSREDMTT